MACNESPIKAPSANVLFYIGCALLAVAQLISYAVPVRAEERISVLHSPPKAATLPEPGLPVTLTAKLQGTSHTTFPLRVIITRDGTLNDFVLHNAVRDDFDRPTYTFEVPAPQLSMSYQFFASTDENVAMSAAVDLRRSCIPSTKLAEHTIDETQPLSAQTERLYREALGLERDVARYRAALQWLQTLKKTMEPSS